MPIYVEERELKFPADLPVARKAFGCPPGECFGCFLGDCAPEMHDIPDACEYLGGYVIELTEGES